MVKRLLSCICCFIMCLSFFGCKSEIINLDYNTLKSEVTAIEIVKVIDDSNFFDGMELVKIIPEEKQDNLLKDLADIDFYVEYGNPHRTICRMAIKVYYGGNKGCLITLYTYQEFDEYGYCLLKDVNPYLKNTNIYCDIDDLINKYLSG